MSENEWPKDVPSPHDRAFIGFALDTGDDYARQRFADRFGAEPEHIVEAYGLKWAGPVPEESDGSRTH